ncbi:Sporulation-specific protein-like protein [Emericellopsis cladophorae]|uniref:Sporulation-specific protein-like protein n=1 Tax=Emericellopsis cladophorae TaxID=2686198 RepID=A0A9P9Y845_9HYPO|nr:Sporulation-specific protein-like protein [Emericellopsis cladophorae]KAI6785304.1 Sporulation-specific protein-like protein [Emericellopsis cladophorae]
MPSDLDSMVKGAAPQPAAAEAAKAAAGTTPIQHANHSSHVDPMKPSSDPTNNAPNSPSMVYLNLLILEASLRAQFLELRARRRHHTFFFALLGVWIVFFTYKLFFAPREDGQGVGGSIYWALEGVQKVCFMGGICTAILVWSVGIWERGIRWPRRWFAISNRGLRGFNCKLVLIRSSWYAEALSTVGFFLTYGLFSHTASSSYRHVEPGILREVERELSLTTDAHPTLVLPQDDEEKGGHQEDLAPGGDYVKLLLLAKPFSSNFRENWELYRTEYWERENERRALLRKKVREHDRKLAKQQFGWLWWLPFRCIRSAHHMHHGEHHEPKPHHHRHPAVERERKRRSSSVRRGSMSSSRPQTPALESVEEPSVSRRTSSASEKRRKARTSISSPGAGGIAAAKGGKRSGTESRSVTPEVTSPLARESSASGTEGRVLRSNKDAKKSVE